MNTDLDFWQFRKLHDKNDTLLDKVEKQLFRYALPNLPLWGPLAPAHDCTNLRALMGFAQSYVGLSLIMRIGGLKGLPVLRRVTSSFVRIVVGCGFIYGGSTELNNAWNPYNNPLYVETCFARDKALQDGEESTYWLGPKNFMPMTVSQYYNMKWMQVLTTTDVEKVSRSKIMEQYSEHHEKLRLSLEKTGTLGARVQEISSRPAPARAVRKEEVSSIMGVFHTDEDLSDPAVVEKYWFDNHPWIKLQVLTNTMYLASNIPRVAHIEEQEQQEQQQEQQELQEQVTTDE